MSSDKQIEEMLKSCPCYHDGKCYSMISPDTCDGGCKYEMYAEALYKAGYEQGVKDFAEKIKRYYNNLKNRTPAALVSFHVNEILKETLEGEK